MGLCLKQDKRFTDQDRLTYDNNDNDCIKLVVADFSLTR